ncbi:MAG: DUF2796 domain-containing protein [Desulfobacterales bacterium]|nr:DUF2796 domain-containing protein [Desulfobacterales bacterium]
MKFFLQKTRYCRPSREPHLCSPLYSKPISTIIPGYLMNGLLTIVGINCIERDTMTRCLLLLLSLLTAIVAIGSNSPFLLAEETRHHEAHEHGIAHLNVALEGNDLYIELNSPAVNIVGFEHRPRTNEQKAAVKKAIESLKNGEDLFILPSSAKGKFVKTTVHTNIEGDSDNDHGTGNTHEHDSSSKEKDDDQHPHAPDHQGDEPDRHSEFRAEYQVVCQQPQKLEHIDVTLFRMFQGIERIKVQLLSGTRQNALELTATQHKIKF